MSDRLPLAVPIWLYCSTVIKMCKEISLTVGDRYQKSPAGNLLFKLYNRGSPLFKIKARITDKQLFLSDVKRRYKVLLDQI